MQSNEANEAETFAVMKSPGDAVCASAIESCSFLYRARPELQIALAVMPILRDLLDGLV